MSEETAREVRRLLTPTDDVNGWLRRVRALDADEALPLLLAILGGAQESPGDRLQAALVLGYLRDPRAVGALAEAMQAADPVMRAQAAESLGLIGAAEERVLRQLIQGLNDEDYFVRECSAKALGRLGSPEAAPHLERMSAADPVASNREAAQRAVESLRGSA
jgi:HEAT repeat protein